MWSPPDRSDVQVMFMDTGIGRWSYKYRGRWYTCWSQSEALYGWVHHLIRVAMWPSPNPDHVQVWWHRSPLAYWNRRNSPDGTPGYWQYVAHPPLMLSTTTEGQALRNWWAIRRDAAARLS